MSWDAPPDKDRKTAGKPQAASDYPITSKAKLKAKTKEQLVDEVHRLQSLVHEVAVEMGIARRSKSSEFVIKLHFCNNIKSLIKTGWYFNL